MYKEGIVLIWFSVYLGLFVFPTKKMLAYDDSALWEEKGMGTLYGAVRLQLSNSYIFHKSF